MSDYELMLDANGQVRKDKVADLLIEVTSGKCLFSPGHRPDELYASRCPTAAEQDTARILYARTMHEAKRRGLKTREELEEIAVRTQQFDARERAEKVALKEMLDRYLAAREKTSDPNQKLQLDADIILTREKIVKIELVEEGLFKHSADNRAEDIRINFFVSACTMTGELLDKPYWESWEHFQESHDPVFLIYAKHAHVRVSQGLPIKIIRAIARTSDWRVRWKTCKETGTQPFSGPAESWDKNKVNLMYWSDFYDSVLAHPEAPADDVVRNDEYLQNWLNQQMAKKKQAPRSPSGRPAVTRNGKPMQKVGEVRRQVSQPYKVRT